LKGLESELAAARSARSEGRTQELLSEIRKHKEEIRALTSRADDLVPSEKPVEEEAVLSFEGILGSTKGPVKKIIGLIEKVAQSDAPVLILGESGTGKELVARALHRKSPRAVKAFVAVNCGALSETLLESELFGHEKGAFTGAVGERAGRFERADGGTIFLDEIGEVTESFQVKLLRVLQEGEFERVGGSRTLRVDVRVLAATNRDLKQQIAERKFREDLYYRLNVLSVELPPLRERDTDLPVLINHFLRREGEELTLSRIVLESLKTYRWPGNIRELESVIKRGALLARAEGSSMITMKHVSDDIRAAAEAGSPLEERILQSMKEKRFSRRSVTETAEELGGLNRGTVAEYLRGEFLKAFHDHRFDKEATARFFSPSGDDDTTARVMKRLTDYLANIAEAVDRTRPWDKAGETVKPKMKNLPQQYHETVIQVASAFHRGDWEI
ncbi:MAG: sigma 54-interacting transcriptional regulator, partial [Ignavibacteria bacterium]|nr:sigma 54-interacting transcriptional regulator [Ignavibacteria bacterium]